MMETAARAQRPGAPTFSAPYYVWEPANKPVSVAIPMRMIEELEREAVESFRCLTSRGSEIGGVLFGTATPGSPAQVTLVSYELIPCDYARGPLYRLADADLTRLDRAIADAAGAGHTVAGFFRSNTRKTLGVDADDRTVLDTRFAAPHHVALLIRPFAAKPSVGGFFIRENGQIQGESSVLEFPFRVDQLTPSTPRAAQEPAKGGPRGQIVPIASRRDATAADTPATPAAPAPAAPAPPAAAAPPASAAAPAQPTPAAPAKAAPVPPAKTSPDAPAKGAPAAPAKPSPGVPEQKPKPAASAAAKPEAKTAPPNKDVPAALANKKKMYTIGGAAAVVLIGVGLFATPAVLHRSSRNLTSGLPDNSLTLRVERSGGELLLSWNRDSLPIRNASRAVLQINDGTQHESVEMDLAQLRNGSIVYSPVTSDVVFKMEVTATAGGTSASESVRVLSSRPSPMPTADAQAPQPATKTPPPTPATNDAGAGAAAESKPAAAPRTLKEFNAQSLGQRLRPATSNDLPEALAASSAMAAPASALPGLNLNNAVAPPPLPAAAVAAPPVPASPKTGGQIQPAELVKRRDPEYPKLARDAGAKGIVQLTATVGADGRVKSVKVVKGHPLLIRAATDAVMQWVYRPTILNGVAVETTTDVVLNFVNER